MANELHASLAPGLTVYGALVSETTGEWGNGVTPEAYDSTHYAAYARTLAPVGATGFYAADMPALPADVYRVLVMLQQGSAPAEGDPIADDTLVIPWTGTEVARLSTLLARFSDARAALIDRLARLDLSTLATLAANARSVYVGDTWQLDFTGDVSDAAEAWFTVKEVTTEPDTEAIVQVTMSDGLVRLNRATATGSDGSIDVSAGDTAAVTVKPAATALVGADTYLYDVKKETAAGVRLTIASGVLQVAEAVTLGA